MAVELIGAWGRAAKPQAGWCEVWLMGKCHLEATAIIMELIKNGELRPAEGPFLFLRFPGTRARGAGSGDRAGAWAADLSRHGALQTLQPRQALAWRPRRRVLVPAASGTPCCGWSSSAGWLLPSLRRRVWPEPLAHQQSWARGGQLGKRAVLINLALGPCPDTGPPHDQTSSFLVVSSVVKDFLIVLFSSLLVKPVLMVAQLLPWLLQLVICYLLQPTPQQLGSSWGKRTGCRLSLLYPLFLCFTKFYPATPNSPGITLSQTPGLPV